MADSVAFDGDAEMALIDLAGLRDLIKSSQLVTERGRALMELGRRTSVRPELLKEVSDYVRDETNEKAMILGTCTVSDMGLVGLVASRGPNSVKQAEMLADEAGPSGLSDLRRLIAALGGTWPSA
jgi:hypothetical protein